MAEPGSDALFLAASAFFETLQADIVDALERLDGGGRFRRDDWTRDDPGNDRGLPALRGRGRTCVLEGGAVLERGGVAFTDIRGRFGSEEFARSMPGDGLEFAATGLSLVLHPRSPHIPTVHCNYRRLVRGGTGWFGGGADLTPNYVDRQDIAHFRRTLRQVCLDHADVVRAEDLERACDQYFYLGHRGETRGVGGLFFDHRADDPDRMWAFVQAAGRAFLPAWLPIAERHQARPWTDAERQWQLLRRGRYVEFNLVWDRGTLFGLRTGGRIESILMSMPAHAAWAYDHAPEPGSPEAEMLGVLRSGVPGQWLA
ncbi:MAG: oxygen-dependent coproporphyrinogen oxidase [Deltaproteobacteria bacterium]|nr:oxygen-dependent coproporphyrinogen oxidase [Deltaproteobacteria bacterium]